MDLDREIGRPRGDVHTKTVIERGNNWRSAWELVQRSASWRKIRASFECHRAGHVAVFYSPRIDKHFQIQTDRQTDIEEYVVFPRGGKVHHVHKERERGACWNVSLLGGVFCLVWKPNSGSQRLWFKGLRGRPWAHSSVVLSSRADKHKVVL